jgi:hypothetical protein
LPDNSNANPATPQLGSGTNSYRPHTNYDHFGLKYKNT